MIGRSHVVLVLGIVCGAAAAAQPPVRDNARIATGTGSISGRVFVSSLAGEAKQPARRVRVTLTSVARTPPGQTTTTDDGGAFTFHGLPPGQYELQAFKNAYLRASYGAARPDRTGTPVVVKDGEAVTDLAMTIARGGVALGVSEERAGVDVTIQLVPTATISGTVSSPSGAPPPSLSVRLVPAGPQTEMLAGAGLRGPSAILRPDGTYVFTGVAPGAYTVKAMIGAGGGRGGTPMANTPTQWAAADVMVNGQDLDVPLTLQPGVAINGRVVFEGSQPTAAELQALSFALVPPGSGGQVQSTGGGRVDGEGRFTFAGVIPDAYRFVERWNAPVGRDRWTIKASTANGRDAFEAPLRVSPSETVDWTVTYTDKPASLAGVFQDRVGRAATDYYILVFASDPKYWTPGSRRIRTTRPATDGAFSVKGLPPGEYFLAALSDLETGEWNDPTLLEQHVGSSAKVTLRDGETTRQDFRIGG